MNLHDLNFLIADSNVYFCKICHGILRSFGASKILQARSAGEVAKALSEQRIDLLLCDATLPPNGGVELTRKIRRDANGPFRTIPILILSSDTRVGTIKNARDYGANMVVAKPVSASSLYDRLAWVAFNPRDFVNAPTYFGPDRRFKIEGFPTGVGRRKGDKEYGVAEDSGPQLDQSDIDSLLNIARNA
jgi:CheY-like chemotaxis protein